MINLKIVATMFGNFFAMIISLPKDFENSNGFVMTCKFPVFIRSKADKYVVLLKI